MADVPPLHKNGKKDLKENYRLVTLAGILPIFSKVFERSMFAQLSNFFDRSFFKTTMWLPERLYYTTMSFDFIRKMETSR